VDALRLLTVELAAEGHDGEIYAVAISPDGASVLTGGWDGHLRLWDASSAALLGGVQADAKPLSACGWSPSGLECVSGSMEGVLAFWDAANLQPITHFMAHTRPVSAIRYAPDGQQLATSSWDKQVALRRAGKEREARVLAGHGDIVAGCRFSGDGTRLLSWSYDGTLRLWDTAGAKELAPFSGHEDRVLAADMSADGLWAVSAGREGVLKLWDLTSRQEAASLPLPVEVRAVLFLPDGATVLVADAEGLLALLSVPTLTVRGELETGRKPLCADLSATGELLAVGCEDGRPCLVAVQGLDAAPLVVAVTPAVKQTAGVFGRILGTRKVTNVFRFVCPACRKTSDLKALPTKPFACPACHRSLRASALAPALAAR
jgi:WD40 repeat protein